MIAPDGGLPYSSGSRSERPSTPVEGVVAPGPEVEVGIVEIFETSYACSPFTLPGTHEGARSTGTWTTSGLGFQGGARVLAPITPTVQGTGLSIAMRVRTVNPATAAAKATALLPNSVAVDIDGYAGIRSWSPPV